jgi:hypothetical protein
MINIRYPNITGNTPEEKITKMESELRKLVDQLNYVIPLLENRIAEANGGRVNGNQ